MNGFILRIIAMLTMVTDHIGWTFLEQPMTLTWIGRIAFPLYAFLLAEGFMYIHGDREKLRKHLSALVILTVITEAGYDLMDAGLDASSYMNSQSNMVNLLLGYIGMITTEFMLPSDQNKTEKAASMKIISLACVYGLLGFANYMIKGNFNIAGPLLVIAFYWYIRESKKAERAGACWRWFKRITVLLMIFLIYLPLYFWVRSGFGDAAKLCEHIMNYAPWIAGHVISAFIISFYNGEQGYHEKWFKKLYVSFYPLHTYVIGLIRILTVG